MIHTKMTKPRKAATKTTPATKTTSKTRAPKTLTLTTDTGRVSTKKTTLVYPPIGSVVEVLIDGLWWAGKVSAYFSPVGAFHVDLFPGAPSSYSVVPTGLVGVWRIANRLHSVPLTRQGVRNLDIAAPPRFRNGRKFRKPRHFEAICSHPEEAMADEPIEEEVEAFDEDRKAYTYTVRFLECGDCGAEISI